MKYQEMTGKSQKELHDLLAEMRMKRDELIVKAREGQLKNVRELRDVKKTIARILTALPYLQDA